LSTGVFGTAESRALTSSICGMQWPLALTVKSVFPDVAGKSDFEDHVVALGGMDEAGTALKQRHKRLGGLLKPFIDADAEGALAR